MKIDLNKKLHILYKNMIISFLISIYFMMA